MSKLTVKQIAVELKRYAIINSKKSIDQEKIDTPLSVNVLCRNLGGGQELIDYLNDDRIQTFHTRVTVGPDHKSLVSEFRTFIIWENIDGSLNLYMNGINIGFDTLDRLLGILRLNGLVDTELDRNLLTFFGDGSAFNKNAINNSAFFTIEDDHHVQIDMGGNVVNEFMKYIDDNEQITKVSILITHLHLDHVGGLTTALLYLYYTKGIRATVYCHTHLNDIEKFIEITGGNSQIYELKNAGSWYDIGSKYSVEFSPTEHSFIPSFDITISRLDKKNQNAGCWYFSGDTKAIPYNMILGLITDSVQHVYVDAERDGETGVHTQFSDLLDIPFQIRYKITVMHICDDKFRKEVEREGFNLPKLI